MGFDINEHLSSNTDNDTKLEDFRHWACIDDGFCAAPRTINLLLPGVYDMHFVWGKGLSFFPKTIKNEEVLRFPDAPSDEVIDEIKDFWSKRDLYKQAGITYKRGILLYGPPGSGKTCTLKLVMEDIVNRGGIAIGSWPGTNNFRAGIAVLRQIQGDTPVVVAIEDIDAVLETENESNFLNLLDGVDSPENVVYVATTNYIDNLEPRIVNRPSRFDRKLHIGMPPAAARELYLKTLFDRLEKKVPDKWVGDTNGFSIAHLKELFISTQILDNSYDKSLQELKEMLEEVPEKEEEEKSDEHKALAQLQKLVVKTGKKR